MEHNKVALVTGASSGIGQGTAIVLAEQGYDVAIAYGGNEAGALETQRAIQALGRQCRVYQTSLEKPGVAEDFVRQARADFGPISLLANNAARDKRYSILTVTRENMDYLISTNLTGYCMAASTAARSMVKDGVAGSIIFITSTRGESAHHDDFLYGGLKAAINRACESMALELAPYGIRVNCIAPGATQVRENRLPQDFIPGTEINGKPFYPLEGAIPLGRLGIPRDTGELAAFLASEKGSYITGTVIRVDGGLAIQGAAEGYAPVSWIDPAWTKKHEALMEDID